MDGGRKGEQSPPNGTHAHHHHGHHRRERPWEEPPVTMEGAGLPGSPPTSRPGPALKDHWTPCPLSRAPTADRPLSRPGPAPVRSAVLEAAFSGANPPSQPCRPGRLPSPKPQVPSSGPLGGLREKRVSAACTCLLPAPGASALSPAEGQPAGRECPQRGPHTRPSPPVTAGEREQGPSPA